ncbi:cupin domain-containing protein [Ruegeria sp. PrR005]|uniref:Cupin domain-containing protein n=1 Tax=Ruegeria sp. PrR005 TaxID=2706882 RepID=A0A6B2NUN3_9RHOB|nr:cupin domain-containing protein [Ruegeria sp. PrR005]NDW46159.1 cupin domain-containing protein [Ruegeria sp. PrR005]
MTTHVIDFIAEPQETSERRLADLPGRVVAGDPHHVTRMRHTSPDGTCLAGTWTSTPGKWHAFTDRDEFCFIVSGHVRLIAEDGHEQEFRTGDSFLIPNGFRGYWQVLETTTKHFVIRDYAPA